MNRHQLKYKILNNNLDRLRQCLNSLDQCIDDEMLESALEEIAEARKHLARSHKTLRSLISNRDQQPETD